MKNVPEIVNEMVEFEYIFGSLENREKHNCQMMVTRAIKQGRIYRLLLPSGRNNEREEWK